MQAIRERPEALQSLTTEYRINLRHSNRIERERMRRWSQTMQAQPQVQAFQSLTKLHPEGGRNLIRTAILEIE